MVTIKNKCEKVCEMHTESSLGRAVIVIISEHSEIETVFEVVEPGNNVGKKTLRP